MVSNLWPGSGGVMISRSCTYERIETLHCVADALFAITDRAREEDLATIAAKDDMVTLDNFKG